MACHGARQLSGLGGVATGGGAEPVETGRCAWGARRERRAGIVATLAARSRGWRYTPEFPFRVDHGAELSLRRLRGRRFAVCFWTSWSEPSITQLREFSRAYKAEGGVRPLILAVGDGVSAERSAELAHAEDLQFPVLPDPERKISRWFGVGCWPSTVWIGSTMRVEAVNFGLTGGNVRDLTRRS
jgi:peroxiredoxin